MRLRVSIPLLGVLILLTLWTALGCAPNLPFPPEATPTYACPLTVPLLLTPPEDSAVLSSPAPGYYFVNEDRSIWAVGESAADAPQRWRADSAGVKVPWFRPAGELLQIGGRRLDGDAPPLEADVPCCYPTRFQATGLYFPTEGCWQVTAQAGGATLIFVVRVYPREE